VLAEAAGARDEIAFATVTGDPFAGQTLTATTTSVSREAAGKPPLQVSAARSSWDLKARTARFEGEVVVTRGDVTMRCAALDVSYADTDTIDRVVATGGVRVDRGPRHAEAERAELVGSTGQITLTGSPRLAEGASELVGARIVLWLDDERATCEGGAGAEANGVGVSSAGVNGIGVGGCRLVVAGSALGK
jgi:lipopolysaccharide export system protein LptA